MRRAPITHSMCNIIISKYVIATEPTVFPFNVYMDLDLSLPCALVQQARSINKPPNSLCSFFFHETKWWCVVVARRKGNRDYLCHFVIVNGMWCTFGTFYLFTVSEAIRIAPLTNYFTAKFKRHLALDSASPSYMELLHTPAIDEGVKVNELRTANVGSSRSDIQKSLKINRPQTSTWINLNFFFCLMSINRIRDSVSHSSVIHFDEFAGMFCFRILLRKSFFSVV